MFGVLQAICVLGVLTQVHCDYFHDLKVHDSSGIPLFTAQNFESHSRAKDLSHSGSSSKNGLSASNVLQNDASSGGDLELLASLIPGGGIPEIDYPILSSIPNTGFSCDAQLPGYYADTSPEVSCQVFHICQDAGRIDSFLCPNGTIFNQQYLICDWWFNFDCSTADLFLSLNGDIGKIDSSYSSEEDGNSQIRAEAGSSSDQFSASGQVGNSQFNSESSVGQFSGARSVNGRASDSNGARLSNIFSEGQRPSGSSFSSENNVAGSSSSVTGTNRGSASNSFSSSERKKSSFSSSSNRNSFS